tara:strand:+ start:318 stop:1343 length:1026 start_codon:yes stop_codon:yes gene_type:complete
MIFKKGSLYSRKDVGWILLPEKGRPNGGDWDTGYVSVEEKLIIFMNIGIPGTTNHDFDNYYDENNQTIVWYGKPRSHSQQPTFQKIFNGDLIPYFFARWDNKDPFTYLGIGKVITFKDGVAVKDGKGQDTTAIELKINIEDSDFIIPSIVNETKKEIFKPDKESAPNIKSSFALEKHLETFIISNWNNTILSENYDIYKNNGKLAQQFMTRSGPLDILAISKDKKEFLVIELKKGRASDEVVGQILRYMGYIKNSLAKSSEKVKGIIIALDEDPNLKDALSATTDVEFMQYQIDFKLLNSNFKNNIKKPKIDYVEKHPYIFVWLLCSFIALVFYILTLINN